MPPQDLPVPNRGGRPKKSRTKRVGVNRLPTLDIDFHRDPAEQVIPCTETRQANHLGWAVQDVRSVNRAMGIWDKIPMVCAATGCYWARFCPTAPDFLFANRRCPLEIQELYFTWVRYIREMEIGPDDHVDLSMVADLCRIDLQVKRIDQLIQADGMLVDHVAGIIQGQNARPVMDRIANPLLGEQSKLRKHRDEIYKQLLQTREQKKKVEQHEEGTKRDALSIFQMFQSKLQGRATRIEEITDVPGEALPTVFPARINPFQVLGDGEEDES